mmetsp:Transcript_150732/g.420178  ORF Transcript_150732/g.420178 Transcript_150732/m.420178 type:complete len:293 (+) Transcript_150732:468-1346(+)
MARRKPRSSSRSAPAESSKCVQYSSMVSQTSLSGTPLALRSLPISSVACRLPMFPKRTRMMSICWRVKSPASHRSKKSCSSLSTSSSWSIVSTCPLSRLESASCTLRTYSSCSSRRRSSFSKRFSVNLFSTRATGVPVQYRHRDWMMEATCSSISRAADFVFGRMPFFMNIAKRTLRPSFSTKIWQLAGQCRNAWSVRRSASAEAKMCSRIMRIINSRPWTFPNASWCAGSNIKEHKQSNMFCTNSDSSLSPGSLFRYAAIPRRSLSTPSRRTMVSRLTEEFWMMIPRISDA